MVDDTKVIKLLKDLHDVNVKNRILTDENRRLTAEVKVLRNHILEFDPSFVRYKEKEGVNK